MEQHKAIWRSFILILKLRVIGELAACKLIDGSVAKAYVGSEAALNDTDFLMWIRAVKSIQGTTVPSRFTSLDLHFSRVKDQGLSFFLLWVSVRSMCELVMIVFFLCFNLTCWVSNCNFIYCSWSNCDVFNSVYICKEFMFSMLVWHEVSFLREAEGLGKAERRAGGQHSQTLLIK